MIPCQPKRCLGLIVQWSHPSRNSVPALPAVSGKVKLITIRAGTEKKKKKKKKKKDVKSDPTVASVLEVEETEEQQEKHQWERKWKRELAVLWEYWESCNIFLSVLPGQNGGSHTGYLEARMDADPGHFFIRSIAD